MELKLQHTVIRVSSVEKAREFYINKLGLEIKEDPDGNVFFIAEYKAEPV